MSSPTTLRIRQGLIAAGLAGIALVCTDAASATATTGTQNWSPDASATENISIAPLRIDASAAIAASPSGIVWAAAGSPALARPTVASARSFFHTVYTTADRVRVRAQPINGRILGVIPHRGQALLMICKRRFSDGFFWGFGSFGVAGNGWIRGDLWIDAPAGTNPSSVYDPTPVC